MEASISKTKTPRTLNEHTKPNLKFPAVPRKTIDEKCDWSMAKLRLENQIKAQNCAHFLQQGAPRPEDWMEQEEQLAKMAVVTYIEHHLCDRILHAVSEHTEPYALMNAIGDNLQYKGDSAKYKYLRILNNMCFDGTSDLRQFIDEFNRTVDLVHSSGAKFDHEQEKESFLMSIEGYAQPVCEQETTSKQINKEGLSLKQIQNKLIAFCTSQSEIEARNKLQKGDVLGYVLCTSSFA